jgi:hypothetical protein
VEIPLIALILPLALVGGALIAFWGTLSHRWLFAVVGVLALVGLQFLIREVLLSIQASTFMDSPQEPTVAAFTAEDAASLGEKAFQHLSFWALWNVLLLVANGTALLWWLRNALRRP